MPALKEQFDKLARFASQLYTVYVLRLFLFAVQVKLSKPKLSVRRGVGVGSDPRK